VFERRAASWSRDGVGIAPGASAEDDRSEQPAHPFVLGPQPPGCRRAAL